MRSASAVDTGVGPFGWTEEPSGQRSRRPRESAGQRESAVRSLSSACPVRAQGLPLYPDLVVGYGGSTSDQIVRWIAAMAAPDELTLGHLLRRP